jgi:hypothetical protein
VPVEAVLFVSFFFGALLPAQEVQQIDLTAVRENRDSRATSAVIRRKEQERSSRCGESLAPTDIHPKEQISVILNVENYGKLPIVLPVGGSSSRKRLWLHCQLAAHGRSSRMAQ